MTDSFDSDILIYLANGRVKNPSLLALIDRGTDVLGSVLLLPETLSKPRRHNAENELSRLTAILSRLDLKAVDLEVADAATALAAKYSLEAADAVHLATAVVWGADRFHTGNRKDFGTHIEEVEVVYP